VEAWKHHTTIGGNLALKKNVPNLGYMSFNLVGVVANMDTKL
jgi:hypothetical protein